MKIRKIVIGAVLVILGLLAVLVAVLATAVYVLNKTNGTLVSSGRTREYLLYVPKSYARAKPTALVISMHAAAMWPAHQMNTSRWNRLADEQGFLVVYPAGGFGTLAKAWPLRGNAGRGRAAQKVDQTPLGK
jgi:poly(3-hydroxybutyrate) depolymerase